MVKKDTGTRSPTAQEIKDWTSWGEKAPKWNLEESRDLIKRHIFGGDFPKVTADGNGSYDGADHPQLKHYVIENAAGKSSLALGGGKDEYVIWIILKNLLAELQNLSINHTGAWCRKRQIGRLIWQLITRGKFYDVEKDVPLLTSGHQTFEEFRNSDLKKRYSSALIDTVYNMVSVPNTDNGQHDDRIHTDKIYERCRAHLGSRWDAQKPIPKGLNLEHQAVYTQLRFDVNERKGEERPQVLVITDLAKDYDDITAMIILKELHRLGVIELKGFVANLMPAHDRARFGRAALDLLDLPDIEIAEGTPGSDKNHAVLDHEFDLADKQGGWMNVVPKNRKFKDGFTLIDEVFKQAIYDNKKITVLLISALADINDYVKKHPKRFTDAVSNVVLQGGYEVYTGKLEPDMAAQNNSFNAVAATEFHKFLGDHKTPSLVFTKIAAMAMQILNVDFIHVQETGHPLGDHLRKVQIMQERNFYTKSLHDDPKKRFAPFMSQEWYLKNKSTWWTARDARDELLHKPGELPTSVEEALKYLDNLVLYDALAAVGTAGEDVLVTFNILDPHEGDGKGPLARHRIAGLPLLKADAALGRPDRQPHNGVHLDEMRELIRALSLGSILASQQKIPVPGQKAR